MSGDAPLSSAAFQLQTVDAAIVGILLDAAAERLEFLHSTIPKVSVSLGVSVHRDELTRFVGEQIGAVIKEQRILEDEYDRLMDERKRLMLQGPEKKHELLEVNRQVEEIKAKLRGANSTLTRSLKENPNVRDNQNKLVNERAALMGIISDCGRQVKSSSNYSSLGERVKQEETELNKLTAVKARLSVLEEEIGLLERETRDEKTKMKSEEGHFQTEYKEVKDELEKHRVAADIELEYYGKRLQTQRETLRLALQNQQQSLLDRNCQVKKQIQTEALVHEQTRIFFQRTIDGLNADKAAWTDRVETQASRLEQEVLPTLKARRQEVQTELEKLMARKDREDRQTLDAQDALRLAKEAVDKRLASVAEMDQAVLLLQNVVRRFIASRDTGKKKKKGGKSK